MADKLDVVGICRFSYLGFSDWRSHNVKRGDRTPEEIIAQNRIDLFSPERLDARFFTFETLTLPSLAAQTDPDFLLVVLTSDELPEPYAGRLRALAEKYPFLRPAFEPVSRVPDAVDRVFGSLGRKKATSLQFRLDDDDAVGRGYIARVRHIGQGYHAIDPDRAFAITFPSVLIAATLNGGLVLRRRSFLNTAGGQAMFSPRRDVTNYIHHTVHQRMLTIVDPAQWVLQSFLGNVNDSGAVNEKILAQRGVTEFAEGEIGPVIAQHFPFMPADPAEWAAKLTPPQPNAPAGRPASADAVPHAPS